MPHCKFREMTVSVLDVRVDMSSGPGSIGPRNCPCFAAVDPQDTELPELRGHRQHTFKEEIRDSIASRSRVVRDTTLFWAFLLGLICRAGFTLSLSGPSPSFPGLI